MSSPIDIVKVFYGTYSLMGAEKAGQYLADEFQLHGFTPAPMDRAAWIGFLSALKKALPDLKIRLTHVAESGGEVRFTATGLGTHRLPLDLTAHGLPVIPAGGMQIAFPNSEWVLTVSAGKITRAELLSPTAQSVLAGIPKAFNVQPALAG